MLDRVDTLGLGIGGVGRKPNSWALPLTIAGAYGLNLVIAVVWPNVLSSFAATGLFAFSAYRLFLRNPLSVGMLAPYVLLAFSVMVSLNLVEAGGYMLEVDRTGFPSFAAASYAGYALLFLCTAVITFNRISRRLPVIRARPSVPALFVVTYGLVITAAIVYLFLAGLRTGFPLLMGSDRLLFRHNTADILTVDILNLKFLIGVGLGTCAVAASSSKLSKIFSLIFVLYIGASMLYGDKFFILLSATAFFLMPFLAANPVAAANRVFKTLPIAAIGVAAVSVLTLYIYSNHGELGAAATLDRLSGRIAGQGQIWFLAIQDYSRPWDFNSKIVAESVSSMFSATPADYNFLHRVAPFFFVEQYYPTKMYASVLHGDGAVTPTMVLEAYGLVAFGYVGLAMLMFILSILTTAATMYLWRAIKTGNPVYSMLPAYLMIQVYYVLTQATINAVFSLPALKAYVTFVVLEVIVSFMSRGMQRGRASPVEPQPPTST